MAPSQLRVPRHRRTRPRRPMARRGVVAVLAMLFLMLFTTLACAMYFLSATNVQSAHNLSEVERAHEAAESGLRWAQYRFEHMVLPKTTAGTITGNVADGLWPSIRNAITTDVGSMRDSSLRTVTFSNGVLSTAAISLDEDRGRFVITVGQDPLDHRYLLVRSQGGYADAVRSISMRFLIDKKVRHAVITKVPLQLGRNTIVDGPVAMTNAAKYPPIYSLSDFRGLTPALTAKIDGYTNWLKANHAGYDNRVCASNATEFAAAVAAGYKDTNGDEYIDEYDLFLAEFDKNHDKVITSAEFTNPSTGKMYDADLFKTMDALDAPRYAGDPARSGLQDGVIDNRDGYAKVRGEVHLATSESAWVSNLAAAGSARIQDEIRGPIAGDESAPGVQFQDTFGDVYNLKPGDIDTSSFKSRSGAAAGTTRRDPAAKVIENAVLAVTDANAAVSIEKTPYGSTSYQATYARPTFRGVTFRNCKIPKGINALFDNCKFEGVTFVELDTNVTNSSGATTTSASEGMTWAKRMRSGGFSTDTALTAANSYGFTQGNNLRFNGCTFEGPIASDVPSAYTHFADSMEFTGATRFDNKVDQTATIVCPQTNIEMGSFTDPAQAPSTLIGVVVAGNIDIRGSSTVDGSIIVTGDGAGNTTLGWFGPSDASTDPTSPMPEGGWGRISIRYNPTRSLPDGINLPVELVAQSDSYREGQ